MNAATFERSQINRNSSDQPVPDANKGAEGKGLMRCSYSSELLDVFFSQNAHLLPFPKLLVSLLSVTNYAFLLSITFLSHEMKVLWVVKGTALPQSFKQTLFKFLPFPHVN